ncbi:MAG: helix-turn-helix domain-containing protein [Acidimicrobiales bacterium]
MSRSVEGYGQFCPVSKAAELICQRWTLLILRELLVGSTRFNEIRRGVPTCSPTLLSKRLKELDRAGIIERVVDNHEITYSLTEAGQELLPIVLGLGEWGQRWVRTDYSLNDLDPGLLLWDVRRHLQPGGLGDRRVTIQFVFAALSANHRYFWLVVDAHEVDLCLTDPGREVDVIVEADLRTLTEIWMGDTRFRDALADGRIVLRGQSIVTRRIPAWFGQHPHFAKVRPGSGVDEWQHHETSSSKSEAKPLKTKTIAVGLIVAQQSRTS